MNPASKSLLARFTTRSRRPKIIQEIPLDSNLSAAPLDSTATATTKVSDAQRSTESASTAIAYPVSRKCDQVDDLHGVQVPDPYRWLEDANSAETKAWVDAQKRTAAAYLSTIPGRDKIASRLTELWDYEKYSIPFTEGGRLFYLKNSGLQNQSVLYIADSPNSEPQVLLDPNLLSSDGTVALSGIAVSRDGRYLAYSLSTAGSDWLEWRVREVATRIDLPDHIRFSKFSGASWTHDGAGFFYCRYAEPPRDEALQRQNFNHRLYFHRIGSDQSEDVLIYERPDHPNWLIHGSVTDDGRYLVIQTQPGTEPTNRLFVKELLATDGASLDLSKAAVPLVGDGESRCDVIGNDGTLFYLLTNQAAPRKRVVSVELGKPSPGDWKEIIPQADDNLEAAHLVQDRLFASYLKDAHSCVRLFDLSGRPLGEVSLPGIGSATGFNGKRQDTEIYYSYTSFSTPPIVFRYELDSGVSQIFRQARITFDAAEYETTQVFYTSRDGARIPMFLTSRRGIQQDGNNPVLLYGYGGFNASMTPAFSASRLLWMEMGGIFAQANLRGGGEYGQDWHDAGRRALKQNVFDDFIGAAEWLIASGYTSPCKLAIQGGSNGGLLVGACLTQRPELFGAALPGVGVMDMLRFHLFTIGWAWKSDFGDPDVPEDFKTLLEYSPLHNISPGVKYPPVLVTTSDHDDRVVPCHSYKFAAALQAAQSSDAPILIRIETQAGHGAGKPTAKVIEEVADQWAFLTRALNME
jgi:prolyl oligopeptidase